MAADRDSDKVEKSTLIGPETRVSGELRGDEDVIVRGPDRWPRGPHRHPDGRGRGIVQADVEARIVLVSGVVVGNVIASEIVRLSEKARVVGDLDRAQGRHRSRRCLPWSPRHGRHRGGRRFDRARVGAPIVGKRRRPRRRLRAWQLLRGWPRARDQSRSGRAVSAPPRTGAAPAAPGPGSRAPDRFRARGQPPPGASRRGRRRRGRRRSCSGGAESAPRAKLRRSS